jgi:hypothetical protein
MITFNNKNVAKIEGFQFQFIQNLNPECDNTGQIKQFMPQLRYAKSSTSQLNPYGKGPFCKFAISSKWANQSGVYVLLCDEELLYIGECINLHNRFNSGYGNISPANCYQGRQHTNCKINTMILKHYLNGQEVSLYFHKTNNYKSLENALKFKLDPPFNGPSKVRSQLNNISKHTSKKGGKNMNEKNSHGEITITANAVKHIEDKLDKGKALGFFSVVLRTGTIMRELNLTGNSLAKNAMRKIKKYNFVERHTKTKGLSSTIEFEYILH